jgi:subtilisin family serine protease
MLSTAAGGGYERRSGTSQAAPVVAGVAAILMSYFPALTAVDVKRILVASATRYDGLMVVRPGSPSTDRVAFSALSRSGGIVNAYAAVLMAERESPPKR